MTILHEKVAEIFETVGLVSPTSVPFTSLPLGKTTFQISTSVGKSIHTYDLKRGLNLVFISRPETPDTITATCAWKDQILVAWSGKKSGRTGIWTFKRGRRIGELQTAPGLQEPIKSLRTFGNWILGCCSSRIEIWNSTTIEHYTTIYQSGASKFTGIICTMPTLLNKILVGKQDGSVDLWNVSIGRLVHTFMPWNINAGPVTALEPSTALHLLAIARADGSLIIHDIKRDRELLRLNANSTQSQPITSISFRSDGLGAGLDGRDDGIMATARINSGDVTIWDLNDGGKVVGVLQNAHYPVPTNVDGVGGGINRVEFLTGQPVMITSGLDNSLKSWIFDEDTNSHTPRPLHSRSGHASQITRLDFVPAEADGADAMGKWLLSSSRDRSLWGWSLRRDGQSTELSQGNVQKKAKKFANSIDTFLSQEPKLALDDLKASEITCIACCLNRDGGMGANTGGGAVWANIGNSKQAKDGAPASGWESIVTGHKDDRFARTWYWGRKKAGRWTFETRDRTVVKSVTMTACGTFALIGSAGGGIDMFNLQSGQHRQQFPSALTPAQARKLKLQQIESHNGIEEGRFVPGQGRHTKAVTGIMVDSLNRNVFSCGLDGKLKFWDFASGNLRYEMDWFPMSAITGARLHRQSDLLALCCDDLSIRVVDTETRKLVRELWGCVGQITDFTFSNDGKWIIAASLDSVIRVWDLPTGHMVDAVRTKSLCTALAFSTTGEYLATSHEDSLGINIWSNRALFTNTSTRQLEDSEIHAISLPTASGEHGQSILASAYDETITQNLSEDVGYSTIDQLSNSMTTLSLVPKSRWQTLMHLEAIAARNKPLEASKAPEKAPFFLPSLDKPKLLNGADDTRERGAVTSVERSRINALQKHGLQSNFTQLLHDSSRDHEPFIDYIKSLSPANADIEIRSLNANGTSNEYVCFISAMISRLRQKRDYELIQAWMSVFLKMHGDALVEYEGVIEMLKIWKTVQEVETRRLGSVAGYCGGVITFLRSNR